MGYCRIYQDMEGFGRICLDMLGYARIWWDMLGYWDMMGYVGICWDMQGYGGICEGWGLHVVRSPCGFLFAPHGFLHLIRKLFKLKRASRSIAKTGFSRSSKSMAGAMF